MNIKQQNRIRADQESGTTEMMLIEPEWKEVAGVKGSKATVGGLKQLI